LDLENFATVDYRSLDGNTSADYAAKMHAFDFVRAWEYIVCLTEKQNLFEKLVRERIQITS